MAKIKVFLDKNETIEEARERLEKAFTDINKEIDKQSDKKFQDPALQDLREKLNDRFGKMYNEMFREIETIIKNPHLFDNKK